jgi:hypothetical protein
MLLVHGAAGPLLVGVGNGDILVFSTSHKSQATDREIRAGE